MRRLISAVVFPLALGVAGFAQAQSCGSGGGATVCLSASGTADNIQLSWTVSGNVTALQVYRDTDSNPNGRSRIAILNKSSTSYTDASAAVGTPYWYWIKFNANGGSYNSGAATAVRGSSCQPSTVWPWIGINGTWTQTASTTIAAGTQIVLGPQPGGAWAWSGCGTAGTSREQTIAPAASCTATAVYTNACGATTTQPFTIMVQQGTNGRYIVIDQFGYLPSLKKVAVLRDPVVGYDSPESYTPGATLQVVNTATQAVVYSGAPTPWNNGATDESSGDRAWLFDFSAVTAAGRYQIVDAERNLKSHPFDIGANLYRPVLVQAVRTFFYQRAGHAKLAQHAGAAWADGASHLGPLQDGQARRYDVPNDASTQRDLRGGWYDAGDLNKYTSWTAGYATQLLHAYTENPAIWTDDFNIPESGNGVPDILDEAKWGMDHLVRLQNADGSVLSIVGLAGASPPSAATGPSLYGPASTSATMSTAQAYAYGAKVFASVPGHAAYAADLAARAKRAWDWAEAHPNVVFYNNDASNGSQGLGAGQQEVDDAGRRMIRLVSAVYMFALTGESTYRAIVDAEYTMVPMFASWWLSPFSSGYTRPLLFYTSLPGATESVAADIRGRYTSLFESAGWAHYNNRTDPYGAYITDYTWASNSVKALAGSMFTDLGLFGFGGHGAQDIANAGAAYLHYLHGVNPFSKVYLSNMGAFGAENSIDQMWHAWFFDGTIWDSVKDSTYGPAPGFLVGGPHQGWSWDGGCPGISAQCGATPPAPPSGQPKQKSYLDFNAPWPLNSWSLSENSNGYQVHYIRLLARFVQ